MFELKPITLESVPRALAKAERYRLLNEPRESESICRDVLAVDPGSQDALVGLILSLTDQFEGTRAGIEEARSLAAGLAGEFDREYYAGVVEERWGKALLHAAYPREMVFARLRAAMHAFDAAQRMAPPGNDDAVLRWNACVRLIDRHALAAADEGGPDQHESFDDDVPMR